VLTHLHGGAGACGGSGVRYMGLGLGTGVRGSGAGSFVGTCESIACEVPVRAVT
jgi:hypothetical protein